MWSPPQEAAWRVSFRTPGGLWPPRTLNKLREPGIFFGATPGWAGATPCPSVCLSADENKNEPYEESQDSTLKSFSKITKFREYLIFAASSEHLVLVNLALGWGV